MPVTDSSSSLSDVRRARPGMRYGLVPIRDPSKTKSSSLDQWATRLNARFKPTQVQHSDDWLPGMQRKMQEFAQLDLVDRRKRHESLVLSISKDKCNTSDRHDMLAFAATIASISLGLTPHDVQLIAAKELLQGHFVEMSTGEGKTLTMALAAAVSAQDGTPVHVLTSSDYLAERDASTLIPFYRALSLSVAFVIPTMSEHERRRAYQADIVHVTGKQVAFDWLRDQQSVQASSIGLASRLGNLTKKVINDTQAIPKPLLRGLCLAIVDEADSLLIDEARTPLVLSAPVLDNTQVREVSVTALTLARLLQREKDYSLNRGKRLVTLTPEGKITLSKLAKQFDGLWVATRYRDEKVREALTVLHCWFRDRDYVVRNNTIGLVDPHTGRSLPDRRLPHGLQTMLELKERCEASPESNVVASTAFQRFFLSYIRLTGMSGTLKEVKAELASVYSVDIVCVQPHKPSNLTILPPNVFATDEAQIVSMIEQVRKAQEKNRPVLIGARTVEQSEKISRELCLHELAHRVLNASQDAEEADVISKAGEIGQITVATNMAGRGTDIQLGPGVSDNDGLQVIGMALNDSIRLDRQLAGRAARQGDPGSYIKLISLEDQSLKNEIPMWLLKTFALLIAGNGSQNKNIKPTYLARQKSRGIAFANKCLLASVQKRIERRHAIERQRALDAGKRINHLVAMGAEQK